MTDDVDSFLDYPRRIPHFCCLKRVLAIAPPSQLYEHYQRPSLGFSRIWVSLYLFQFLQMQRTNHLTVQRISDTRKSPDVIHVVGFPFMLNGKLNTGVGV